MMKRRAFLGGTLSAVTIGTCTLPSGTVTGESTQRSLAYPYADDRRRAVMSCSPISVKDPPFSAAGNGSTNDTNAIQRAFNAAFGSDPTGLTYTPNGKANWQNNRPVFFPGGVYRIGSPGLVLTQVYRGLLYAGHNVGLNGDGTITGNTAVLRTDGFEECRIEKIAFNGNSAFQGGIGGTDSVLSHGGIGLDLDWNGTGDVQLRNNTFFFCSFGGFEKARRIASQGWDGSNNNFIFCHCQFNNMGTHIVGNAATDNQFWSHSLATECGIGIQCDGGSFKEFDNSISRNHILTQPGDVEHGGDLIINSTIPCLSAGNRKENSGTLCQVNSGATLRMIGFKADGDVHIGGGGTVILDTVTIRDVFGTGNLRMRGAVIRGSIQSGINVLENV